MKHKFLIIIIINFLFQNIKGNNITINNTQNSSLYDVSMIIYNNEKKIDNIFLNLTNYSKHLFYDTQFSYTGKILYLREYKRINILKENSLNYRIKWIFMFSSTKELSNFVQALQRRKLEFFTNAIIVTKNLSLTPFKYYNYLINLKIFIFYLDNEIFEYIVKNYDYINKDNDENIYARLLSKNNKEYHLNHLYIIIYLSLLILLFCIILFRYYMNKDERNINFFFIRTVYFFPVIKIAITLFYIAKLKFLQSYNDLFNIGTTSILSFLISSLNMFFKSLFVLFSIFASHGIDATLRISSRFEFLIFMRKFILIYIILSSILVNNEYFNFFPKFLTICSFIVETIIIYLIYKNKKKSQTDYIKKLNLATLYFSEYITSIKIKLNMITWHWRVHFSFYIIIIFLNIYTNIYDLIQTEKGIYFHFADVVIILCYSLIYKPRKWPQNFDVFFKNDFNYFDNIYQCKLNLDIINNSYIDEKNELLYNSYNDCDSDNEKLNISETIKLRNKKEKKFENKIKKYYNKNKNFPIFILNPKIFFINNKNIKNGKKDNGKEIISNNIKYSMLGKYNIT